MNRIHYFSHMLKWWIFLFIPLLISCSGEQRVNYEDLDIEYIHEIPNFKMNGAPFSGIAVEQFSEVKLEHYIETGMEVKQLGFYLTGEKEREFYFQNGKKHGDCTMWWKDGTLLLEEHYEDGDIHGEVRRYDHNGEVLETKTYVNGILEMSKDTIE